MKAMFLVFHALAEYSGITKKIRHQVKALNECGVETDLCYLGWDKDGNQVRWVAEKVQQNYGKGTKAKILKRYDYRKLYRYIIDNQITLIYMRSFLNAEPFLIHFVSKLKHSGVKVVMEIPTYPYDDEGKELPLFYKLRFKINKLFRVQLCKSLERIITFSDYDEIFRQKTTKISNGVDFDSLPLKQSYRPSPEIFYLIVVAELHYWHGVDRAISGISEYIKSNPKQKIHLNIVGKPERESGFALSEQTKELEMENYITFFGALSGKELDEVFEKSDFGIGSLARHRSNITHIKTLKNREYAARGIPFVYSEIDTDFEQMPYIIKAPADDSPLDIQSIVDFYYNKDFTPENIRSSIEPNLSWKNQMQKVLDEL